MKNKMHMVGISYLFLLGSCSCIMQQCQSLSSCWVWTESSKCHKKKKQQVKNVYANNRETSNLASYHLLQCGDLHYYYFNCSPSFVAFPIFRRVTFTSFSSFYFFLGERVLYFYEGFSFFFLGDLHIQLVHHNLWFLFHVVNRFHMHVYASN